MSSPSPTSSHRLVDHVEVAQAEEVDLQQAERLDVAHRELRHDLLVGALLLERHDLDQRPVADHDAGGVDRVLADEPLERLREVDDLAHERVGVVRRLQLLAGLQATRRGLTFGPSGIELRDPVDGAVGHLEHAAGVADRGARRHRPEGDDLGDAVAAVLLGDVVDDAVAAGDGEVDVDVRHRLAARVEEALEEQVVPDRVDVGDLEAVGDERAGGRAAARADADPVPLREADEVPDDQEVVGEAHLADRLQLEREPLLELGRDRCRSAARAPSRTARRGSRTRRGPPGVGYVGSRIWPSSIVDVQRSAISSVRASASSWPAKSAAISAGRLEEELVGVELPVVRVLQRVARLDAEQRLVRARVLVRR